MAAEATSCGETSYLVQLEEARNMRTLTSWLGMNLFVGDMDSVVRSSF